MNNDQRKDIVRIGIAIRQKEIAFSIASSQPVTPEILYHGEYLIQNHSPLRMAPGGTGEEFSAGKRCG